MCRLVWLACVGHQADENRSGLVDVFEFVRLFSIVWQGKAIGIAQRSGRARRRFAREARGGGGETGRLQPGDEVYWKGSDEQIPRGTLGRVLMLHSDGDVEVLFVGTGGPAIHTFSALRLERRA